MADEEKKKKIPMMLIVVMIVVGLALAGGISYFIASKIVADKSGTKVEQREPGTFVKLGDPKDGQLVVNIGGPTSGRYLKIGIVLEMKPQKEEKKDKNALSPQEVKVQDTVLYVLRSQKVEDFDPSKQENLKELIKREVNKSLGEERVYEVYITNFILQ